MSSDNNAASPVPGTPGGDTITEEANANNASANTPLTGSKPQNGKGGPPSAVEFEPPVACVRRILKKTLPSSSNVGKDAVAAFARASGIFIIYLTACANDFARENRRQTITANDVLAAIKELEFDEFAPELTTFLERYRELEKTKKNAKAASKAAAEKAKNEATKKADEEEESTTAKDADDDEDNDNDNDNDNDDEDNDNGGDDAAASNNNGEDAETDDKAEDDATAMEE